METTEAIATSYINGNLMWVKEESKKDPARIAQIHQEIKEMYGEDQAENFIRWVAMW